MNTAADVTDLNLATQKIEQSEKNIRNMILQAPVAMCFLEGPSHVVEIANKLMIELWGKPQTEVLNKPIFEGLPDARNQGLEKLMSDVYTTGEGFLAYERPVSLLRNGKMEEVYQNFVYEPYRDSEGNIIGILAITVDVTTQVLARRKIEEIVKERTLELADANKELRASNAELEQFAYIASHDLQEPLRKISTFTQMLEYELGAVSDKSKSYLNKINDSSARMTKLVRDVLAYSQLSKESRVFDTVDLNKVLDDIKTDFELLVEQKKAVILSDTLPVLKAIPLQMSQLMSNLISNALKFSSTQAVPEIRIQSKLLPEDQVPHFLNVQTGRPYYQLDFSDNGIGFKQEHAEQIFNIFQRLHAKSEFAGTGIGLAMCKKIALNHHGDIYAKSIPGKGTTFTILLPA